MKYLAQLSCLSIGDKVITSVRLNDVVFLVTLEINIYNFMHFSKVVGCC